MASDPIKATAERGRKQSDAANDFYAVDSQRQTIPVPPCLHSEDAMQRTQQRMLALPSGASTVCDCVRPEMVGARSPWVGRCGRRLATDPEHPVSHKVTSPYLSNIRGFSFSSPPFPVLLPG